MKKNLLLFIFLLFSLLSCGFEPIYKINNNLKINIEIVNATGDKELNNFIMNNLNKRNVVNYNKVLKFELTTSYAKNILLKDASGTTTDFELKVNAKFLTKNENNDEIIEINENFKIKKMDNSFDEEYYERTVKENLSSRIVEKFISNILYFK